jgi:hypothetical protein
MHIVLYKCETLLLTLRQEHRLRGFENRVLRRIFGPKREKVTDEWTSLHNKELNDLYYLPNIILGDQIKKNEIGVPCSRYRG